MADQKFLNGIRVYSPLETAPDFVKGAIVINSAELISSINELGQDEIRLDIKESREGKLYASINEYKPRGQASQPQEKADMFATADKYEYNPIPGEADNF